MNTTAHVLQTLVKGLDDAELTQLDAIMHSEIGQRVDQAEAPPKVYAIRAGELYELPTVTTEH